jgi:hypothetical protein
VPPLPGSARWAGAVFLGKWNVLQHVVAPERLHEEEAQSRHSLANAVGGEFSFSKQMDLILANVLRSQLVRSTMEVLGELLQNERVSFYGILGVISALEFRPASVFANGSPGPPFSVTHTIAIYRTPAPLLDTRSVRLPAALLKRRSRRSLARRVPARTNDLGAGNTGTLARYAKSRHPR